MTRQITLQDATAPLAEYVAAVEVGEEVVITRDGKPVAKLTPITAGTRLTAAQITALTRTLARADQGYSSRGWKFNRDELYER